MDRTNYYPYDLLVFCFVFVRLIIEGCKVVDLTEEVRIFIQRIDDMKMNWMWLYAKLVLLVLLRSVADFASVLQLIFTYIATDGRKAKGSSTRIDWGRGFQTDTLLELLLLIDKDEGMNCETFPQVFLTSEEKCNWLVAHQ